MTDFLAQVNASSYLLLDGAMGTALMNAGLAPGQGPEELNVAHPERVQAVHQAYIAVGSRIILTNSFGGSRFRLKLHGLQDHVYELNHAAATIAAAAAAAAGSAIVVAGSIGPCGEIMQPIGELSIHEATAGFVEQAQALVDGGVDVLWIETMSDLNEVRAIVSAIRQVSDLPIAATMSFDTNGRTMMGVCPAEALVAMKALGVAATGANCGNGLAGIIGVIEAMRAVDSEAVLIAKSNAGIPRWDDDQLCYDGAPALMGSYANLVHHLGAKLIGGCCGSSPAHVAAMAESLAYFSNKPSPPSNRVRSKKNPARRRGKSHGIE